MITLAKRAYHHGNLRAALLKATLRAIAEDGPEGFTLRDVARRAGVSAAAPYRHFPTKDDLLAAVAGECAERLAATIAAAVDSEPEADALGQFRLTGIAYVQFAAAHPEHFRALHLPGMTARIPAEQRAPMEAFDEAQLAALGAAQAAGTISSLPLDELVLTARAGVIGLGHMIVAGELGEVSAARAKQLAIAVTEVLGQGLIARPPC